MSTPAPRHPREVLLGAQAGAVCLPACDHYAGVEARMRKSLALQAEWSARDGVCQFDVTLDCEDGAPVGGEAEHAALVVELVRALDWTAPVPPRVGVRVHPVDHPAFESDIASIVSAVGTRLTHLMVPKVESVADVARAAAALDAAGAAALPLHVLIESPAAVHRAFEIAAHPRVASLSFGLMDFVSAHGGAIPAAAMTIRGQFEHPLVRRAKLEIASAAHAHGKVPSHSVVTEFRDRDAVRHAAERAASEFGYTRMWSIHPDQIEPIIAAFRPRPDAVEQAAEIIARAAAADWAPISHQGHVHDRASFRYFWQVLERAYASGVALPETVRGYFP
ncbi:MAG: HpcH/HpaI aldolase/citrate lyase family protein [Tepidimonas sp.]|uniref:HpcH/HpaI aldolase/citrate lyase family protein n=1 Tax=Tepidimonas sp. TaxID=2002775 RepID=UPI004055361B